MGSHVLVHLAVIVWAEPSIHTFGHSSRFVLVYVLQTVLLCNNSGSARSGDSCSCTAVLVVLPEFVLFPSAPASAASLPRPSFIGYDKYSLYTHVRMLPRYIRHTCPDCCYTAETNISNTSIERASTPKAAAVHRFYSYSSVVL